MTMITWANLGKRKLSLNVLILVNDSFPISSQVQWTTWNLQNVIHLKSWGKHDFTRQNDKQTNTSVTWQNIKSTCQSYLLQILVCLFVSLPKYDLMWLNILKVASLKVIKFRYKYNMEPFIITFQCWDIVEYCLWNWYLYIKMAWLDVTKYN